MARVITYKEARYSTIELDSKERIMISVAQTGIEIYEMKFLGLIPKRTIATWTLADLPDFLAKLGGTASSGSPFRYTVDRILTFPSIRDLEEALFSSTEISDDLAQDIVYAFINRMAEGAPYIGDAETLPYPKETIRKAFVKHIEHYEVMRSISEETFQDMGYHETLDQLNLMCLAIDDWHNIDSEDKEPVARLNAIQGPPPEWALPLMVKYIQRSTNT